MEKQFLKILLDKFYTGTISTYEKEQLEDWYQSFKQDEGYTVKLGIKEKEAMGNSMLEEINAKIDITEPLKDQSPEFSQFNWIYSPRLKVAAVFFIAVTLAALAYAFLTPSYISHSTNYGQIAQITLPDHSTVVLNGNSSLQYKESWSKHNAREVFLEGDAFFSVTHSHNDQKFLVHTSDRFHVEVLGTEFTVSKRPHNTRVVLNSGRIELNIKDQQASEKVAMKPGDLVEFKSDPLSYSKKKVNPEVYSSWKEKKLILDRTSLKELLAMIQDIYGLRLYVIDENLLDQKISGKLPAEDLHTLIKDISAIYKVKLEDLDILKPIQSNKNNNHSINTQTK